MKKTYEEKMIVHEWVAKALLQLMEEKPYEKISITELTKKAGVPRMTFYRNYSTKDDVLIAHSRYLSEKYSFGIKKDKKFALSDYISYQFSFTEQNEDFMMVLVKCQKEQIILDRMNQNIDSLPLNSHEKLILKYYAGGIHNIIFEWLRNGKKEDRKALAEIIIHSSDAYYFLKAEKNYLEKFDKIRTEM